MYSCIKTSMPLGMDSVLIHVETDISDGLPVFDMVGYLSSEVKEAKDRVRTALKNSGIKIPPNRITINLTPVNLKKFGNRFDLPIAAGILCSMEKIDEDVLKDCLVLGEVGLGGSLLPVSGILSAAILASSRKIKALIIPCENAAEAALIPGIRIIPVGSISEFISVCQAHLPKNSDYKREESSAVNWETRYSIDFSEIQGQPLLRRACEIAASGMHNLLLLGPPGSGKSMAAKRIPTILPDLTKEEKIELSQIYSLSGRLDGERLIKNERPFRSPHHTVTAQAIAGGGNRPKPGEVSLSHRGILYLDELPEFRRETLEVLREPLEDRRIHISRISSSITYPADFLLVASMNPCPCGYYPDTNKCRCTSTEIKRYMGRISQAFLDRIDLCVETREVGYSEIAGSGCAESSASIRERVTRVHAVQAKRFAGTGKLFNSRMNPDEINKFCTLSDDIRERMEIEYKENSLTARTYHKVLCVARTIADMDGSEKILWNHISEALMYRGLSRKYWMRF